MDIRYDAYLIRHWQLADGQERVEIREMATGERQHYQSLAEACRWIAAQGGKRPLPTQTPGTSAIDDEV